MLSGVLYLSQERILPCLCCAALHECGHLAVCRLLGLSVKELEFRFTGLTLRLYESERMLSPIRQILLHGGGIFANLIGAAVFAFFGMREWAAIHLILALFHAIPMNGMDGGRIWEALGVLLLDTDSEMFGFLGQGVGFLIFSLLAAAAVSKGQMMLAFMVGSFALCGILPQQKKR